MTRKNFLEGTDFMKAIIFSKNKGYRKPIEDKVATWVKEGWATWEEEKPEWFTDKWKASVPEYMKPTKGKGGADGGDKAADQNEVEEALMVGGGGEQNGRRRSVLEIISGQKAGSSKVMPAGDKEKKESDLEEFERAMRRRGSINM